MNVWGLGAWRLSVSLCSRASVWVPVARNWHYLAWPHSSITEEDQLALNAGWLKSCPLLDKSGQKWILAGDGLSAFDPMYGPAVRCNVWSGRALQVDFAELAVSGLASMYPASDWSVLCSGPSWISARVRSH